MQNVSSLHQDMGCLHFVIRMKYLLGFLCILGIILLFFIQSKSLPPIYEPDVEYSVDCKTNLMDRRVPALSASSSDTTLYLVTPTYRRVEQLAELTRLGQTLLTVPSIVWMVVEDADTCSQLVAGLLERLGMPYVHLASAMPAQYRSERYVPRGVSNRRAALKWLRAAAPPPAGVLYFLDDDNTVDIRLFEQIRHTKKVSMFPVGLVTDQLVSSPIIANGRVTGWFDGWVAGRRFAVDMAGFALNLQLILSSKGTMPYHAGYEEDKLLQALDVKMEDIEPLANQCTEVLVWHTKTKKNKPPNLSVEVAKHKNTNVQALVKHMEQIAMATA